MNCPQCGQDTSVVDSRVDREGTKVRRRRVCPQGHRTTTYEMSRDESWDEKLIALEQRVDSLAMITLAGVDKDRFEKYYWRGALHLLGAQMYEFAHRCRLSSSYFSKPQYPADAINRPVIQAELAIRAAIKLDELTKAVPEGR